VLVKGGAWRRPEDAIGVAGYLNAISQAHRDYLAAGGQGFFLGDGQLNYGQERIFELFYSLSVVRGTWLTADFQQIANPGYNRDRGPAQAYNLRAHFEF
jgi:carbohydrate-selective porin OprB